MLEINNFKDIFLFNIFFYKNNRSKFFFPVWLGIPSKLKLFLAILKYHGSYRFIENLSQENEMKILGFFLSVENCPVNNAINIYY